MARGQDEQQWVARAQTETVRALEAAVRAAGPADVAEEEGWELVCVPLSPEGRATLDQALELAGRHLGPGAPQWQRLEAICQEYLAAHPVDTSDGASFAHYCAERLGMATDRATQGGARRLHTHASAAQDHAAAACQNGLPVLQRECVWLERRLYALPPLRRALREGRVGYEKARLVAAHADDTTVEALIERAQGMTCMNLKFELEARDPAQMCARGELDLRVPRGVGALLDAAVCAAREAAGYWLSPGECIAWIAEHFVGTWEEALAERSTRQKKVIARDAGFCQVPGCSRAAAHAHHVLYRSRGGVDEESNMVSLCATHHLHGVHRGWVRVRGRAPEGLTWELGVRPGGAPLAEVGVH
jgi:5-methylcytosine-specific restriction endonuclease McrA